MVRDLTELTEMTLVGLSSELVRPFVFFGHSLGALIAFQIARELQARQMPGPDHLFVAGRAAPSRVLRNRPLYDLSDQDLVNEVRNRYKAIPAEIASDPELLALLLPALRADFELHETYRYRAAPPLRAGISAYGGLDDHNVREDELDAWKHETNGRFSKKIFGGDHFFIHSDDPSFMKALSGEIETIARLIAYQPTND